MSDTAQDAIEGIERSAEATRGAMSQAVDYAGQWIRSYPFHALAVAFAKGVAIGLYMRRY